MMCDLAFHDERAKKISTPPAAATKETNTWSGAVDNNEDIGRRTTNLHDTSGISTIRSADLLTIFIVPHSYKPYTKYAAFLFMIPEGNRCQTSK